jgi:nitrate reductase NapE component
MTTNHAAQPWYAFNGRATLQLFLVAAVGVFPLLGRSQIASSMAGSPAAATVVTAGQLDLTYVRPSQRTMLNNYAFDAFGPYPIAGAAVAAGINQFGNAPPEWNQGLKGYSRRFGSDFGIVAVGTTTRYALAEAFKEDTLYYRCDCTGVFPRMRHAVVSTLIARRGDDGHRVFSFPSLVAPYAGTMTAVYGWFPNRFGAKDAFRMGNYNLLAYAGGNIALEFFYSGPHSLLSRMHLNNQHGAPDPGPNHSEPSR